MTGMERIITRIVLNGTLKGLIAGTSVSGAAVASSMVRGLDAMRLAMGTTLIWGSLTSVFDAPELLSFTL